MSSNPIITPIWEFDDAGTWHHYSSTQATMLEKAFSTNPAQSSFPLTSTYDISFSKMTQTNTNTKYTRSIRRTTQTIDPNAPKWSFEGDFGNWIECTRAGQDSAVYEGLFQLAVQSQDPHASISAANFTYLIDFVEMVQTNTTYNTVRSLRRSPVWKGAIGVVREVQVAPKEQFLAFLRARSGPDTSIPTRNHRLLSSIERTLQWKLDKVKAVRDYAKGLKEGGDGDSDSDSSTDLTSSTSSSTSSTSSSSNKLSIKLQTIPLSSFPNQDNYLDSAVIYMDEAYYVAWREAVSKGMTKSFKFENFVNFQEFEKFEDSTTSSSRAPKTSQSSKSSKKDKSDKKDKKDSKDKKSGKDKKDKKSSKDKKDKKDDTSTPFLSVKTSSTTSTTPSPTPSQLDTTTSTTSNTNSTTTTATGTLIDDLQCPICHCDVWDTEFSPEFPKDTIIHLPCTHVVHRECLSLQFKSGGSHNGSCPVCKTQLLICPGPQPTATCEILFHNDYSCGGFAGMGSVEMDFELEAGLQDSRHKHPGTQYHGDNRRHIMPQTPYVLEVLLPMYIKAFMLRHLFDVGYSFTRNTDDVIIYSSIHLKTDYRSGASNHSYPDAKFIGNATAEILDCNITMYEDEL